MLKIKKASLFFYEKMCLIGYSFHDALIIVWGQIVSNFVDSSGNS